MAEVEKPDGQQGQRRAAGLDPIGHVLRQTYDAENHDSLGNDLTGLMLQLAVVNDDPAVSTPAMQGSRPAVAPPRPRRWWERLFAPVAPR
jgi:hypothetical protein